MAQDGKLADLKKTAILQSKSGYYKKLRLRLTVKDL